MSVGAQVQPAQINQQLTAAAVQLRNVCNVIRNLQTYVVGQGTAGLVAIGFTAPDAAGVTAQASYMATVAGCYFGTVQQGGSGGTGAVLFDFDNELSAVWAGQ